MAVQPPPTTTPDADSLVPGVDENTAAAEPPADEPEPPPTEASEPDAAGPPDASPDASAPASSGPSPFEAGESPPPEPEARPSTVAPDFSAAAEREQEYERERAPLHARDDAADEDDDPFAASPTGAFISLSVGAGSCGVECSFIAAIGGARFEAGYRWGHVAIGGRASLLGGNYDTPDSDVDDIYFTADAKGSMRFSEITPFVQIFFASAGRFDPYAAFGLGYRRVVDTARVGDPALNVKYWESGAGVSVAAGVPIRVSDRVSVGLRYDKTFSLGGELCATVDGEPAIEGQRCESWSDATDELNEVDLRYVRRARLRPWTLGLELRLTF